VRQYRYRRGSGGAGEYHGGDGLVREIELLTEAQVTLLCDRRKFQPYGLHGGCGGQTGATTLVRSDGTSHAVPGKCSMHAQAGDAIRMETPGGGGWGTPPKAAR
jgi:N-methylhydantoinase B